MNSAMMEQNDHHAMSRLADELSLLVRSKYQVIYLESTDEEYALSHFEDIAQHLGFIFYQWSITEGLRREDNANCFYQTKDPVMMMRTVLSLSGATAQPGLFVLKDFHKQLEQEIVLRCFKDLLQQLRERKDTVAILAPEYKLPVDIEPYTGHIVGNFPDESEIIALLSAFITEAGRCNPAFRVTLNPEERSRLLKILKGLSIHQIRTALTQAILTDNLLSREDLPSIEAFKRKTFNHDGTLEFCETVPSGEIAGFLRLKDWLAERREAFKTEASKLPPPKGVLLMGVQGCGKSLAVKVVANELDLPLYRLDMGALYSSYIGQTEQNLKKALATAENLSPICLWLDEIEKAFAAGDSMVDGGVSQRVLGIFLTWMQERKVECFLAATANDVQLLPPELLRKGRFDEIFFVDLPDAAEREILFHIHLRKRGLDPETFSLPELAAKTDGFSGAEIEQVIISALYGASHQRQQLSDAHILEKAAATKPLAVLRAEEVAALRAWARGRTVPA